MPILTDVKPLSEALNQLTVGEAITHGALTVFPLLGRPETEPDWLTLSDAMDVMAISEVDDHGVVPALTVSNSGERPVLLLDGEELIGAKQNRVLNTTVLVGGRAKLTIPVSCVEAGRWNSRSRRFSAGEVSLFASARAKKAARVTESLRRGAAHRADQDEVWSDIAAFASRLGVESPTAAMHDVYARRATDLTEARRTLAARPGQLGAVVYVARTWCGVDLLASADLFARAWPRLCTGYVAEALGRRTSRRRPSPSPRAVLDLLGTTPVEPAPAVGLGHEHRLAGKGTQGAALVLEPWVAHLMAFPAVARN